MRNHRPQPRPAPESDEAERDRHHDRADSSEGADAHLDHRGAAVVLHASHPASEDVTVVQRHHNADEHHRERHSHMVATSVKQGSNGERTHGQ